MSLMPSTSDGRGILSLPPVMGEGFSKRPLPLLCVDGNAPPESRTMLQHPQNSEIEDRPTISMSPLTPRVQLEGDNGSRNVLQQNAV